MIQLLLVIFLIILLYAWLVEPGWLDVREETVEVDAKKLERPVRLLFLSDLHAGALVSRRLTRRKLDRLAAAHREEPFQAVLLGGDFVDRNPAYVDQVAEIVSLFVSWKVPVYGVLGNHDYEATGHKADGLAARLEATGMRLLRNQSQVVACGSQELLLIGLDELESQPGYRPSGTAVRPPQYRERAGTLDGLRQFKGLRPELPRVVLVHNPDGVYLPGDPVPDVVLAGHTHGGQYAPLDWFPQAYARLLPFLTPREAS